MGNKAVAHAHLDMISRSIEGLQRAVTASPEVDVDTNGLRIHMERVNVGNDSGKGNGHGNGRKESEVREKIEPVFDKRRDYS